MVGAGPIVSPVAQDDLRIGVSIRLFRVRSGRRQIDVAEEAGVSRQCVSLLECGRVALSASGAPEAADTTAVEPTEESAQ